MKDIKFRQALFTRNGQFHSWHHWGFIRDGLSVSPELNSSTHQKSQEHSQQYTGLKDKKDREIYEGDIIRIKKSHHYGDKVPTTVTFQIEHDGGCSYSMIGISPEYNNGSDYALHDLVEECEVIGNIYENPELLNQ